MKNEKILQKHFTKLSDEEKKRRVNEFVQSLEGFPSAIKKQKIASLLGISVAKLKQILDIYRESLDEEWSEIAKMNDARLKD